MKTKVKLPPEDPAIKAARDAEQRRADSSFRANVGEVLDEETRKRIRRFGARFGAIRTMMAANNGGNGGAGGGSGGSSGGSAGTSTGGGRGGACPAPWVPILLEDGSTITAGELEAGARVLTWHEDTLEPGAFTVEAVSHEINDRWELALVDGRVLHFSPDHRLYVRDHGWTTVREMQPGVQIEGERPGQVASVSEADRGAVVRITISDAHTYVTDGLLSHNAKPVDVGL